MDLYRILRAVDVFRGFDDAAVRRLSDAAVVKEYSAEQVVHQMGGTVSAVGVVVSGELSVKLRDDLMHLEVSSLKESGVFGEMSLLTGEPAVADLTAKVPSRIIHVPHDCITQEIGKNPKATQALASLFATRFARRKESSEFQAAAHSAAKMAVPSEDTTTTLVLNLGSSSIKYATYRGKDKIAAGHMDKVGEGNVTVNHFGKGVRIQKEFGKLNHEKGLVCIFELLLHPEYGAVDRFEELSAVGHRVVHGGDRFNGATVITKEVIDELEAVSHLAPLHNPINIQGIKLCQKLLPPTTPQVAVFDTAFHMTIPQHAYTYALPSKLANELGLRRYGFHGTSHKYVAGATTLFLEKPDNSLKIISCHLGNGASIAAINHGRSVDTSMGLTPLEGLIMGSRSGDVDPGLILHLLRLGKDKDEIESILNHQSGLLGISGLSNDMRELEKAADMGHEGALLAIQSFCYRVRKYIGAYAAAMGGLDALAFTGGIGQNSPGIRQRICSELSFLGVELDNAQNNAKWSSAEVVKNVSKTSSGVEVVVVDTDEEEMIAQETAGALSRSGVSNVLEARRDKLIPIGVSAHHVHLCKEHIPPLFGKEELTPIRELSQKGNFSCEEQVDLIGPKGEVKRVRVLGPPREKTQVEVSRTDEFKLGIDAPIRASGDVANSPGVVLRGPKGEITIDEGVICAYRHIHMDPADALAFGIKDRDVVRVKIGGERSVIFGDVLVRVFPGWSLEMHLDTDEANAAEVSPGMAATIESIQKRAH